jgi:hypothetical protein
MFRRGHTLLAKIEDIDPQLLDDLRANKYRNFSIALYSDLNVRHIGILGAVPPAVKDLNKNGVVFFHQELEYEEYNFSATMQEKSGEPPETNELEELQNQNRELLDKLNAIQKEYRQEQ